MGAAAIAIVPIAIFTDVCYSAYLNSLYMDAVALCSLLLMAASAVWLAVEPRPRVLPVSLFGAAALLFATSKPQHAVWMLLPAGWLIACGSRTGTWRLRLLAWSAATLVLAAGSWMLVTTDECYRGYAMFNLLFYRLGSRGVDLAPLGVAPEEMRYHGMHSYVAGAPTANLQWTVGFYRRTGFKRLLWHIAVWYGVFSAGCLRIGSRVAWVGLGIAMLRGSSTVWRRRGISCCFRRRRI